jgi:MFS family permease
LREGWAAFVEQRWIPISAAWIAFYFLFTLAPVFVIGPAIAKEHLGGSSAWATILTSEAVGALLGGLIAIRWRPRRPLFWLGAFLGLAAIQPALLAVTAPVAAIAWGGALTGFGFAFGTVVYETLVQERVRPEHLSRVSAYDWFTAMCCLPLGYALAGPAADLIGMNAVLWFGAVWMAVSTLVYVSLPGIRNLRTGEPLAAPAGHEPAAA